MYDVMSCDNIRQTLWNSSILFVAASFAVTSFFYFLRQCDITDPRLDTWVRLIWQVDLTDGS